MSTVYVRVVKGERNTDERHWLTWYGVTGVLDESDVTAVATARCITSPKDWAEGLPGLRRGLLQAYGKDWALILAADLQA